MDEGARPEDRSGRAAQRGDWSPLYRCYSPRSRRVNLPPGKSYAPTRQKRDLVIEWRIGPTLGSHAERIGCAARARRAPRKALARAFGVERIGGHRFGKRSARGVLVAQHSKPSTAARPPWAVGREDLARIVEEAPLLGIRGPVDSVEREPAKPSQHGIPPSSLTKLRRDARGTRIERVELF